jgi:16S rRNA processing protein RimM
MRCAASAALATTAAAVSAGRPSRAREASLGAASADAEPFDWPADAVEVGRIVDAWGVQGGLRVQPFSGDPQALFSSRRWLLRPPEAAAVRRRLRPRARRACCTSARARAGRRHRRELARPARPQRRRGAARLAHLCLARQLPEHREDEYYWVDLIGLAWSTARAPALGTVADLIGHGRAQRAARDQAARRAGSRGRAPDPFVAAYVDEVSSSDAGITVDWGLDY